MHIPYTLYNMPHHYMYSENNTFDTQCMHTPGTDVQYITHCTYTHTTCEHMSYREYFTPATAASVKIN